jgi:hypothetical protein
MSDQQPVLNPGSPGMGALEELTSSRRNVAMYAVIWYPSTKFTGL